MDAEAEHFLSHISFDPWAAVTEPLPIELDDLNGLRLARRIIYSIIHVLDATLDESLELIGRLAEIDRRIALIELCNPVRQR